MQNTQERTFDNVADWSFGSTALVDTNQQLLRLQRLPGPANANLDLHDIEYIQRDDCVEAFHTNGIE